MLAYPPAFNANTMPGEEEQSLDLPTVDVLPLDDVSAPLTSLLDLSADLSPDLIDIAALARDEQLPDERHERNDLSSISTATPAGEQRSLEADTSSLLSSEEPDLVLTVRQQRALRHIARRHMHYARITRRTTAGASEPKAVLRLPMTQQNERPEDVEALIAAQEIPDKITQKLPPQNTNHAKMAPIVSPSPPPMPPLLPRAPGLVLAVGHHPRKSLLAHRTVDPRFIVGLRHRRIMLRRFSRKHLRRTRVIERRVRRRLWINIACAVLALLLVLLSLGSAAAIYGTNYVNSTISAFGPKLLTLRDLLPLDNLKMYDSKGVLIAQLTDAGVHTTVSLDKVSPYLKNATVATEDKDFWSNGGVDITAILRAAWANLQSGRVVEGGSTITQQLIKNLVVGNDPSITRKLQEIILASQLNTHYTKSDILEMYLNSIYYGHQAYGIDAAASIYFGLEDQPGRPAAMQLDLAQSAMLAGIPGNPSAFDPLQHPQAAFNRFGSVLGLMVSQGYITEAQSLAALHESQSPHFFKSAASLNSRAPHFAEFVYKQLEQQFHLTRQQLSRSGMIVYTTLDIGLQDKIQVIAQQHIAELRAAHHLTNAAEVLIDFHTGAIISLLGSIDYNDASIDGQFDVATQAYRQPGSSFKPYVYVTAFAQGASPAQAIDDEPTTFPVPDSSPPTFTPSNYDQKFHGHMTLRCALQNSLNVPGVKVLQHVGVAAAMQTAYNMGITSYQGTPGLSLVLGGLGIRLIDHTSAMGVFANGGVRVPYYAINEVVSANTAKVLYQHQIDPGKQVISPQLAYMMTSVLSDNASRIPEFYDCNVLQLYSNSQQACWEGDRGVVRPAAVKTGTTNDFRDNWTVGYTTDYVMGVWAGNDDNSPMINVTGVQGAAPIWHDSMLVAEQGHPIRDFVNPGGLVLATVTYPDGVETTDWFLPGTVPTFAIPTPTPTPALTATPTPADDNGTPTSTSTPTPAQAQNPGEAFSLQSAIQPYCPNSYSFAFPPPPDSVSSPTPGWW